jgi:cobalt-zinc-cadmium resistance protein CzcA
VQIAPNKFMLRDVALGTESNDNRVLESGISPGESFALFRGLRRSTPQVDTKVVEGPALINRSMGKRRIVVGVNVQDRDLGGFVAELQQKVDQKVHLPAAYYIEWGGQFHNMERALNHLTIIVPITIAAIFFLLFILFNSVRFAALIITVLPLASIGGVLGLFIFGEYLSV